MPPRALKVANRARANPPAARIARAGHGFDCRYERRSVGAGAPRRRAGVWQTCSLQKARSALCFHPSTAADMVAALPPLKLSGRERCHRAAISYLRQNTWPPHAFFNDQTIFANGMAFSNRAIGTISRDQGFPDGISCAATGTAFDAAVEFLSFHLGLQRFDLQRHCRCGDRSTAVGCMGLNRTQRTASKFFQVPVPVFRGNALVGATGISGDSIDQDDMIAFAGLANAGHVQW